jgi:hypothetical protein
MRRLGSFCAVKPYGRMSENADDRKLYGGEGGVLF